MLLKTRPQACQNCGSWGDEFWQSPYSRSMGSKHEFPRDPNEPRDAPRDPNDPPALSLRCAQCFAQNRSTRMSKDLPS